MGISMIPLVEIATASWLIISFLLKLPGFAVVSAFSIG
jgi:hypothetical protein